MATDTKLTKREAEVLSLVVQGKRNRQIARQLQIAEATVENHLHRLYAKLQVSSRTEAALLALRTGICNQELEGILQDE